MDVGCSLQGFGAQNHALTSSLGLRHAPNFPKIHPNIQCKGAPICPSTAYQGAKTLCIYMIWMWDVVYMTLEPQP